MYKRQPTGHSIPVGLEATIASVVNMDPEDARCDGAESIRAGEGLEESCFSPVGGDACPALGGGGIKVGVLYSYEATKVS